MVKRVFKYSKEVALKNGNRVPAVELAIAVIIGGGTILLLPILFMASVSIGSSTLIYILLAITVISIPVILILGNMYKRKMVSKMTGFAIDENGRLFRVVARSKGEGLFISGVAVGRLFDMVFKGSSGHTFGSLFGGGTEIFYMNKTAEYMSNPEIIARMVEGAPNITGADVYEIQRVYTINKQIKKTIIYCDYLDLRANRLYTNSKVEIENSYFMIEDLINYLYSLNR